MCGVRAQAPASLWTRPSTHVSVFCARVCPTESGVDLGGAGCLAGGSPAPSGAAAPTVPGLGLLLAAAGFFINPFCEPTREFML